MTVAPSPPELRELSDEYEVLGELGRGGSAVVYRARDRALGREVAIKVVSARPAAGEDDPVVRLAREARTVAQLQHPNIVAVYAVRRLRGGLALVMPLVPGLTLKQIVQGEGPLAPERCERVLRDVAAALAYAHGRGVVHRDVKPENIFLDEETGQTLLADFGIARSEEHESLTMTGTAIGTPFYMSPEQIENAPLDGRSDLYSLGLVAWELLTGRRPWDGESLYNVIYKQKHEELPPIQALRPGVPPRLQYIVERMLQKQPGARWAGADGLLAQLEHTVLPRDYSRWQASVKKRVERYRAEEKARREAAERDGAQSADATGSSGAERSLTGPIVSVTMRVLRGVGLARPSADTPSLANTMRVVDPTLGLAGALPNGADVTTLEPPSARDVTGAGGASRPVGAPVPPAPRITPRRAAMRVSERLPYREIEPSWGGTRASPWRAVGIALASLVILAGAVRAYGAREPIWEFVVSFMPTLGGEEPDQDVSFAEGDSAYVDAVGEGRPGFATAGDAPRGGNPPGGVMAAGGRHSCVIALGSAVHCWGANERGQLGNGTFARRVAPAAIAGDFAFAQLSAGASHTCAVTRLGEVYCWGSNTRGQLGDATTVRRDAPVRVAGGQSYAAVRAGTGHSCAVTTDRAVYCWGANDRGQLGDSSRDARVRPARVGGAEGADYAAVAVGGSHTCALAPGGAASCWGANDFGQLGDGATADRAIPAPVAGEQRFAALAVGQSHSCGVTTDGVTLCWGRNAFGELGTRSAAASTRPSRVEVPAAAAVTAGSLHSCALTTAGGVFCWGRNNYGQLGDGTTATRRLPARVTLPEPVVELDASGLHTCALGASGRAYCWGYNGDGQLGDSTLTNRPDPVEVRLGRLSLLVGPLAVGGPEGVDR